MRKLLSMRGAVAAATLATLLASGVAIGPAAAAPDETAGHSSRSFRHHFYRGQPYGTWEEDRRRDGAYGTTGRLGLAQGLLFDTTPMPPAAQEEAEAYCADRYRSYDPSSGTYLGYDGQEHACP